MKALRIVLLSALGLITLIAHDLIVALVGFMLKPTSHEMLGYGSFVWYVGWIFILTLPLCIGVGGLWFKDIKSYIPHVLLLIALSIY